MPSKRFLGLGFTFSATDRGLEKKLKSVHNQLRGIGSSLGAIHKGGSSAQKALRNVGNARPKNRIQQPGGQTPNRPGRKPKQQGPAQQPSSSNPPPQTNFNLKKSLLEKELIEIGKKVHVKVFKENSDRTNDWLKKVGDLPIRLGQTGKIVLTDYKKLVKLAKLYEKQATITEKYVRRTQLKLFFTEDIPNWLKKIKSSMFGFLESLGLRLNEIIPEPFKALGRLIKDVASLPMRVMSKAVGLDKLMLKITDFFTGDSEQKLVRKAIDDLKGEIGGTQTGSTNSILKKILESVSNGKQSGADPKGGMFSKIGDFLKSNFAFLAGIISSVGGLLGTFGGLLKKLPLALVGKVLFKFLAPVALLYEAFNAFKIFKDVFAEKGVSFASVVEGLWKVFDQILFGLPSWLKSKVMPEDKEKAQKTPLDPRARPVQQMQTPVVPPQYTPSQASATQHAEILQEQLQEARRSNDLMKEMVQILASSQSSPDKDRAFAEIFSKMGTTRKGFSNNFAAGDETPL